MLIATLIYSKFQNVNFVLSEITLIHYNFVVVHFGVFTVMIIFSEYSLVEVKTFNLELNISYLKNVIY